jgi:hypothetical protein
MLMREVLLILVSWTGADCITEGVAPLIDKTDAPHWISQWFAWKHGCGWPQSPDRIILGFPGHA